MDIKIDIELEYRWSCFSCTGNQIILDIYSNWTFSATLTPLFLFKKVVSVPEKSKYYSGQKNAISNAISFIQHFISCLIPENIHVCACVCVWGFFFLGGGVREGGGNWGFCYLEIRKIRKLKVLQNYIMNCYK